MVRINQIINHPLYVEYLRKIKEHEKDRIFCKHDMNHFLDVCRIAENLYLRYCLNVQDGENTDVDGIYSDSIKEYIYAVGVLHDIGRWQEYEEEIRHEIASATLAKPILIDCGFEEQEIREILLAISNHRNKNVKDESTLSGWIYQADKKSRSCFSCEAEGMCDWSKEKKNMKLT